MDQAAHRPTLQLLERPGLPPADRHVDVEMVRRVASRGIELEEVVAWITPRNTPLTGEGGQLR